MEPKKEFERFWDFVGICILLLPLAAQGSFVERDHPLASQIIILHAVDRNMDHDKSSTFFYHDDRVAHKICYYYYYKSELMQ